MSNYKDHEHLLILDFDGVIVDSIEECLVVGYNAAREYLKRPERIKALQDLPSLQADHLRRLRTFVRTGEDYVYLALAEHQARPITNQQQFDQYLAENRALQPLLRRLFYETRQNFLATAPAQWLALNPFYPGMREFLLAQQGNQRLLILTTKQLPYVQAILANAGVQLATEQLYSVEQGHSKVALIRDFLRQYHVAADQAHFIDDQVDTLLKASSLGVQLYLAQWGYVNADQLAQAHQAGIRVVTLAEFCQLFHP